MAERLITAMDKARRSGRVVHEHELTEAAFDEAIAAEREACAKIAEQWATELAKASEPYMATPQVAAQYLTRATDAGDIAAAIRARGQQ